MRVHLPKLRWLALTGLAAAMVALGCVGLCLFQPSPALEIREALWVKRGGVFHAPGSPVSLTMIDRLDGYVGWDGMTFSGPVVLLLDSMGGLNGTGTNRPLWVMPYAP